MKKLLLPLLTGVISANLIFSSLPAYADYLSDAEERKSWPVQSAEIENWPEAPSIGAASAILMDADSGIILYEKNVHEKMYPASTTKLLTCLLAMEKKGISLNDMVSFSYDAVFSVPRDGSNMGIDVGEAMTLEDCLYGILVLSANEVCNGVAEYVSGDIDSFVELMNRRAEELGCVDSHFNNAHGYTDPDHYTSAYDLALIGREFFKNELLAKMSRTKIYHWLPTDTQPDDIYLPSRNYFYTGAYNYEGIVGSKTGYTDESRNCLVTCAERGGVRLICVIMMEETPYQYDDTVDLFNYGFSNFDIVKVADYETKYEIDNDDFFKTRYDLFGNSSAFLSLDDSSEIVLPKTCTFEDLTSTLVYHEDDSKVLADIDYSYNGKYLGSGKIIVAEKEKTSFVFSKENEFMDKEEDTGTTYIYVNKIVKIVAMVLAAIVIVFIITRIFSNFHFAGRRKYIRRPRRRNKRRRY